MRALLSLVRNIPQHVLESFKPALDMITNKSLYFQFSLSLKSAEVKVHFSKNGSFVRAEEH
jgi:hypothetical protein